MEETQLLPLERLLKEATKSHPNRFPTKIDYFARYLAVKEWLTNNVYKLIGAALSSDGGIYTDHGADHFDEVIRYAGLMVGAEEVECIPKQLEPYEVYVLLMSILLHDAGNVFGRTGHEKNAYELLHQMGELSGNDNVEKKEIANVAQAHGGKTSTGDKDTIAILTERPRHVTISFRARVLAGVLRFADEICEHRGRGAGVLLDRGSLSRKSEVYHVYAESITSAWIDRQAKAIDITYNIPIKDATRLWGKDSEQTYLTDEILLRLEKMELERKYCSRFMYPVFVADRINATINIRGDQMEPLAEYGIRLEESGYPSLREKLADRYPELLGQTVHQRFAPNDEQ